MLAAEGRIWCAGTERGIMDAVSVVSLLPALLMARQEQPREDLLREATALVERAELIIAGFPEAVVIGFRSQGAGCVYLGQDPVYQFDSRGQLRRGYWQDKLVKADQGRLAFLTRQRGTGEVQLVRHDLTDKETADYLRTLSTHLDALRAALAEGSYQVLGQVPADGDVVGRIRAWLDALPRPPIVAPAPNVR